MGVLDACVGWGVGWDVGFRVCEQSRVGVGQGVDFLKVVASWFSLAPRVLHYSSIMSTSHVNGP